MGIGHYHIVHRLIPMSRKGTLNVMYKINFCLNDWGKKWKKNWDWKIYWVQIIMDIGFFFSFFFEAIKMPQRNFRGRLTKRKYYSCQIVMWESFESRLKQMTFRVLKAIQLEGSTATMTQEWLVLIMYLWYIPRKEFIALCFFKRGGGLSKIIYS